MSTPGVRGRRADAERNRQRALEAATALLAEPGSTLTVDAIAAKAGMGAGTVVRAFGGKDALLDAAVSDLLEPVVGRGKELLAHSNPDQALRTFLTELMTFQAAHHSVSAGLAGVELPTTTELRGELVRIVGAMIDGAQRAGTVRTDFALGTITTMIGEAAFAIARSAATNPGLTDTFITVLMDGLAPR
ncbi:TetR/AcrR family transcriptional regulator [Nocardia sp. NBC_01327]|uniref:TetR/AcrR family transcriptional regulator n=1 Tax=Nocardia sp. NBC_01327 TaxID=2903593 RepID=UPI002E1556DB|nr:TetR/AcrR family transcriptional regulator [Nocardia sp. NBC_01327]